MNSFWEGFEKRAADFTKLKALGLADNEYCVLGGVVELLGIRKSNDIDLIVTPEAFNRLVRERGLKVSKSFRGTDHIEVGNIEIFKDDGFGRSAQDWARNARKVNGFMTGSPKDMLAWKKKLEVMPGRNPAKKDIDARDIQAFERLARG